MDKKTPWALYAHNSRIGYRLITTGHKGRIEPVEWVLIDNSVDYQQASDFMQEANRQGRYSAEQLKEMWNDQKQKNAKVK